MDRVEDLILAAWKRVGPRLDDEPLELARRLARRGKGFLTRPPRAWCIALRASDRRIASGCHQPVEQQVTLTSARLRKICAKLRVKGETADEVAAKLGTTERGLVHGRIKGTLRADYVQGLGGRHGPPVPILYADRELDPCAKQWNEASELWDWTARFPECHVPDGIEATLTRVPQFRAHVSRHLYDENRHPEVDPVPPKRKSQRMPKPPPDLVWYKWSLTGDYYLGDDPSNWRKDPKDLGDRPPKWLKKSKRKRRRVSTAGGSLMFRGFQWHCPVCGRTCGTLYYPHPPVNLLEGQQPRLARLVEMKWRLQGFACRECHGVNFCSTMLPDWWNQVISYLTAGLMYGHEVEQPKWFTPQRKNAFAPRPTRPPSRRRAQITELILAGKTRREIEAELGLKRATIDWHAKRIFAQHGVHTRAELARKLRRDQPPQWQEQRVNNARRAREMLASKRSTTAVGRR